MKKYEVSDEQAKHYRYGLVGLKGFLFKQFATVAASKPELLVQLHLPNQALFPLTMTGPKVS